MTLLEKQKEQCSLAEVVWKHPNPEKLIDRKNLPFRRLERMPCRQQMFTTHEVAQKFVEFMQQFGLVFTPPRKCKICRKFHVQRRNPQNTQDLHNAITVGHCT